MRIDYDAVLLDLFGTLVDDAGRAIDGAQTLLDRLAAARWAIVTSCPRSLAHRLLERAGLRFPPHLICADDVVAGKPAPDGYLLAAERLGVRPERCLVVEDSGTGIAAGRAAAMDVVAVFTGRHPSFARAATFALDAICDLNLEACGTGVVLVLDA